MVIAERKGLGLSNLYVGTIGWSYNFWKGPFYPKKQPSIKLLNFYALKFNSVEVDGTFYRIPTQQTVINWRHQTPEGFLFSLKFPQVITHLKMLRKCQNETDVFLDRVKFLEEKLGALLLQFPPSFGVERLPDLADFLGKLPRENRYVVEIRNKNLLNDDLFSVLRENNVALAWVDSPLMPTLDKMTSDFLYVRLEGDRKKVNGTLGKTEADRSKDIEFWTKKLKPHLDGKDVFVYFGKYYSGYPPLDVRQLLDYLA